MEEGKKDKDAIKMNPQTGPVEYNPLKQYTWDPNAQFVLTGNQFGLWLNSIRTAIGTKEAAQMRMLLECNEVIEGIMAQGVKDGDIVEIPPTSAK